MTKKARGLAIRERGQPSWGPAVQPPEAGRGLGEDGGSLNCAQRGLGFPRQGRHQQEACTQAGTRDWRALSSGDGEKQVRSQLGLRVPGPTCLAASPPPWGRSHTLRSPLVPSLTSTAQPGSGSDPSPQIPSSPTSSVSPRRHRGPESSFLLRRIGPQGLLLAPAAPQLGPPPATCHPPTWPPSAPAGAALAGSEPRGPLLTD